MTDGTPNFAPGTPSWVDLGSSDLSAAVRFYGELFGWQSEDMGEQAGHYTMFFGWGVRANPMPQGGEYVEWLVGSNRVAGAQPMGDMYPPQVPPHWLVYFAVADADATVQKAQQLGGQVRSPLMDIPQGRF